MPPKRNNSRIIALCTQCGSRRELQACLVCEKPKCKQCSEKHEKQQNFDAEDIRQHIIEKKQKLKFRINELRTQTNIIQSSIKNCSNIALDAIKSLQKNYEKTKIELRVRRDSISRELENSTKDNERLLAKLNTLWKDLERNQLYQKLQNTNLSSSEFLIGNLSEIEPLINTIENLLRQIQIQQVQIKMKNESALSYDTRSVLLSDNNRLLSRKSSGGHIAFDASSLVAYSQDCFQYMRYSIDLDIIPSFISVVKNYIFICDEDGYVRVYSYSKKLRRQPLLKEKYTLQVRKMITAFTCTTDYLISYEKDVKLLSFYNYHGGIIHKLIIQDLPDQLLYSGDGTNDFWMCSHITFRCSLYSVLTGVDSTDLHLKLVHEKNYKASADIVEPVWLTANEKFVGIHDLSNTKDRMLLYDKKHHYQYAVAVSLECVKYYHKIDTSNIYSVLLHPTEPLLIMKYVPDSYENKFQEIVVVDWTNFEEPQVISRIQEQNIYGMALTDDNEVIFGVVKSKKKGGKLMVYNLE
ncbi:unnamed protein product [Didymodactylos carnosus]|uniref:B box-type domain-containing protein n=1 Tax=Didymodactylos carnosus TaxID=1234261 RepID=A0A813RX59_9BILA|nr:unnamed protein product [Didymodactylos carnosus]CAF0843668.1 unnamed protein product [Didymodactylos carnosus]CAF3570167.1 unnamed protein product [Didymodactylos carnosus]CAF3628769.1 unnamed protein product [Didymodactylos carnosus]